MLPDPYASRQVWFLTGSQGLYGDDVLEQVADGSRRIAAALDASDDLPLPVVLKPVLTDPDAIRRVVLDANADDACVGLVAWMHTFSPARMWVAGLEALQRPLLHLHTQVDAALPWSTIDMDFMNLNQAAHGDREFGYVLTRLGVRRTIVAGHVSDPTVTARVGAWSRAATGLAEARALQVARFGDTMRDVAVTEGDRIDAQQRVGVTVNGYGVNALAQAVLDVERDGQDEVDAVVAEYEERYDVAPQLRAGGERHGSLRDGAAIEVGLRRAVAQAGARAFTTNFQDLGTLRQLPGLAVQRLMADGYGFAGEGDWKTAALLRILKVVGHGRPGGTSFMEDYTYHLGPGTPKVLGAHMLEVCPTITSERPRVEVHPLGIGDREDPVRMVFTADPGAALVVGWCDLGERSRWVANEVDVVPPDEDLPNLPVARAVWQPRPDLRTSAESWLAAGGPHHTVLSSQLGAEELTDLAEAVGLELALIDASTTARGFRQQLRWEQAHHRLAQGF